LLTLVTNLLTEEAEDALEYELATWLDEAANLKGPTWKAIRHGGRPVIGKAVIGGTAYKDEIVPLVGVVGG
jgi:hypothetical protein